MNLQKLLICGMSNATLREKLLQDDNLTLQQAVELCVIIQTSKEKSAKIGNTICLMLMPEIRINSGIHKKLVIQAETNTNTISEHV